ncbi:hypothetical protein DKT77_13450 [Meridianimarinicoccus roseus]|uniref:HTH lacI-type domain-containing protein n=1 Tax=Meridianimarinicoccus roseus TaxID=2072018 RepID=A0A2V2L9V5_9RHOB|nr:hypothetical protein DKT77_13450 [Meridianimarinicoccus roseus]
MQRARVADLPGADFLKRRCTIRDVAEVAGVSVGTVSNVLTGQRPVRSETRALVEAAIKKLGYVPDVTAQALIGRRGRAVPSVPPDAPRLYCVGYVCSDDIAQVAQTPQRGERMLARSITRKLGGRAANVAVAAAGLGPPMDLGVELLSVLGHDGESDWATATLASRRVALAPETLFEGGGLSRAIIVLQGDGLRTILNEPLQVAPAAFDALVARAVTGVQPFAVFVQGEQVAALADAIRSAPCRDRIVTQVSGADAAGDPDGWRRNMGLFGMTLLNTEAATVLYGAANSEADLLDRVARGAAAQCPVVALTLGASGAALFLDGTLAARLPAQAGPVLDETGAGDAFAGAFLAGWLHGHTPEATLAQAIATGTRAVAHVGAQEHGTRASDIMPGVAQRGSASAQDAV